MAIALRGNSKPFPDRLMLLNARKISCRRPRSKDLGWCACP